MDAADASVPEPEAAVPAPFRTEGAVGAEGELRGDAEEVEQEELEVAQDGFRRSVAAEGGENAVNSDGEVLKPKNWLNGLVKKYLGRLNASTEPYKLLFCPNETETEDITTNYGLNYLIATENKVGIKTTRFKHHSKTAMLVENTGHLCYYCDVTNPLGKHDSSAYGNNRAVLFRHNDRASVTFLDGHAEAVERKKVPCKESFPELDKDALEYTLFNRGVTVKP